MSNEIRRSLSTIFWGVCWRSTNFLAQTRVASGWILFELTEKAAHTEFSDDISIMSDKIIFNINLKCIT